MIVERTSESASGRERENIKHTKIVRLRVQYAKIVFYTSCVRLASSNKQTNAKRERARVCERERERSDTILFLAENEMKTTATRNEAKQNKKTSKTRANKIK